MRIDPVGQMYEYRTADLIERATKPDYYRPKEIRFRASELTACPRQIFHRLMGERPLPTGVRTTDYGASGDACHDIVRRELRNAGMCIEGIDFNEDGTQVETVSIVGEFQHKDETIKVASRLDGILEHCNTSSILEIKSVGYWKYKAMIKAYDGGGAERLMAHLVKKHLSYIWQCHACMQINDKNWAYIVIYDRSEARIGIHPTRSPIVGGVWLPRDDLLWDTVIIPKLYRIQCAVKRQAAMRPAELPGSQACGWCAFQHACHDAIKRRQQGIEPAVQYPFDLEKMNA